MSLGHAFSGLSTRSVLLAAAFAALPVLPASAAPGADAITDAAAMPEVENSRFQFEGEVNANAVYVRSGPSDNDYATAKLDKGAKVTVVGIKFDWLKILPPADSFCYVAKAYVEKRGDGKIGRVTNTLNVRVGSSLLPMKTKVATKLEPGMDVQIVGEQDEYFKVRPPEGVFLYVNKQFVDPVRRVEVPGIAPDAAATATPTGRTEVADAGTTPPPGETTPPVGTTPDASSSGAPATDRPTEPAAIPTVAAVEPGRSPVTGTDTPANTDAVLPSAPGGDIPSVAGDAPTSGGDVPGITPGAITPPAIAAADTAADGPTTRPTGPMVSADIRFDQLEARLKESVNQPIEEQPVPELLAGYQQLVTDSDLPESMRRIAEHRVATLTVHNDNRELTLAHKREMADREARQIALRAEGEELMQRLRDTGVIYYTAVGTLRESSLQLNDGSGTLYRLTDPVTGRLLVHVKSNDPALARMMNQFVGVRGDVMNDPSARLQWITPTTLEPVDQKKVNRSVAAKLTPPSLLPGGSLAGGND